MNTVLTALKLNIKLPTTILNDRNSLNDIINDILDMIILGYVLFSFVACAN